jgi:hypothetical protein
MKSNAKTFWSLSAAAVMCLSLVMIAGPSGAASNKTQLSKAWSALLSDYNNIVSAVTANNSTKAETNFAYFSRDCVALATFETSFNSTINSDIYNIAVHGNAWAWIGYITLTSNSGTGTFQSETTTLTADIKRFSQDLSKYGLYN